MRNSKVLMVVLMLVICLAACKTAELQNSDEVTEKSLYEHGLDVIALMVESARSEEYLQVYTGSEDLIEIIKGIGEGDFTKPKAVYEVMVPNMVLWELADYVKMSDLSEGLRKSLEGKMLGALATRINALSGANNLAATSVCSMGKVFVKKDLSENVIYIYTYENAVPVAVTFTAGEDGAVSAGGNFIVHEEFTCGSAEEIKAFLGAGEVTEIIK